jgi:hypothetical protein
MIRLFQILFVILIIVITDIHARRFKANKPIGPLFHFTWAAVYFIPAVLFAWHLGSWWLAGASAVERFVLYNPILNLIRGEKFFYLHSGKNGSWWDDLELMWSRVYPWIWGLGVLIFIIIQFFL